VNELATQTLGTGIHRIPMSEYLADPCARPSLNAGTAWRLLTESPKHAWLQHPRLGGQVSKASSASDLGSVAHDLLLGGEGAFAIIDPCDYPSEKGDTPTGWTNKAIRAARDKARDRGLVPILAGDMIQPRSMVTEAREFLERAGLAQEWAGCESELTVISECDGATLRARPDRLNIDGYHFSYKTTARSVHPRRFARMAENMGYLFGLEFYRRALDMLGHRDVRHIILAQEQRAPYACNLFELSRVKAQLETEQVDRAIEAWNACLKSGRWPDYGHQINAIEPQSWELIGETEVEFS